MSRGDAEAIVGNAWNSRKVSDPRLGQALAICGLTMVVFRRLLAEARRCERRLPRLFILTPTGTRR